jgi:antitoxin component YwqK of YwqJK toxin-antitoxin module
MVGHSISYYETGTVYSEGKTNNKGVMVGKWVTYYPDGKTRTVEKHNRRGKLKTFDSWDQEGNHVIVNGTGTLVTYYPDGSIEQTVTFKDCRFEGANEGWYPNGQKEHELFYKDGKPIGVWRFWNENGELVLTESYEE